MIDYRDLGGRIRMLRRVEHLTQTELAEKLGISLSFMGHIERGSRVASLETLVTICNELKTTPTHLLEASLTTKTDAPAEENTHPHSNLTPEQRKKLQEFLTMAQEFLENCDF